MLNVKPSSLSFSTSPSVSFAGLSSLDFSVGIVQPKCLHTSRFNSLRSFNCSLIFIIEIFKHKNKNKLSIKKIFYIKKGAAVRKLPPPTKKQKGNLYSKPPSCKVQWTSKSALPAAPALVYLVGVNVAVTPLFTF